MLGRKELLDIEVFGEIEPCNQRRKGGGRKKKKRNQNPISGNF